jgi:predicted dehydrogenase
VPNVNVRYVCDLDKKRLANIKRMFPAVTVTTDIKTVLKDRKTHGIAVATPVRTHYPLAKLVLEAGKHVLVEKPLTASVEHAVELIELAKKKGKILAVDHTFVYNPAVMKMKQIVKKGELGDLFYFDSVRANLGLFQNDTNVLWDLATHDLSIMDYLLEKDPVEISAIGASHIRKDIHNIVYVTTKYPNNLLGHIHVNWVAPVKLRLTLLSGYHKMIAYNDLEPVEKIKIYDRSIKYKINPNDEKLYKYQYRVGDIHSPRVDFGEALYNLAVHFTDCIRQEKTPITDGVAGLRIVKMLTAAQESLNQEGQAVSFNA